MIAPNVTDKNNTIYQNPLRVNRFSKKEIITMKIFYLAGIYKIYYFLRTSILYEFVNLVASFKNKKVLENRKIERKSQYIYAPNGCFMIFTPTYFNFFDGLDENTFLYCEEFILAEKLYQKNLRCWYENDIHVIHLGGQTTNKLVKNQKEKIKFVLKYTFESYKYLYKIVRL